MNIYEALEKDHREVENLLDKLLVDSQVGNDEWKTTLDQIRAALIPHSRAEEAVFYNALREEADAKDIIGHSYKEHLMAEGELRTLGAAKMVNANWTSLVEKLRKDLQHHIDEEEHKIFTIARTVFNDEEARQMGAAFLTLKQDMQKDADSLTASTVDAVANLLPERYSKKFRSWLGGNQSAA